MFAVAVLLALLKLGGISGARSFVLKMVPATPVRRQCFATSGRRWGVTRRRGAGPAEASAPGTVSHLLTIGSKVLNLPGRQDSGRTEKPVRDEVPVFYRPAPGEDVSGEPVCGNVGGLPESSTVVFPLPEDYFDS